MEGASIRSAVAEKAQDDLFGGLELLSQSSPDCNREVAAYDASGAQVPVLDIRNMHRAAFPFAVPTRAAEHFSHHLVVMRLLGFGCTGDFIPMCMGVTMTAMGAGDQVIIAQG